ncbi:hypothetical protein Nepgr_012452 [Nepenthes gracilis]|uniref:Uncharacterized protein n=1 Tax=Nepenthes gracilis TaxID=150966 RepID=A0AAD3SH01_NEPGR|nr:hypothetical protein Nepgr_012452 [Nepenthes gracilis]
MSFAMLLRYWTPLCAVGFAGGGFGAGSKYSGGVPSLFWIGYGATLPELTHEDDAMALRKLPSFFAFVGNLVGVIDFAADSLITVAEMLLSPAC